MFFLARFFCGTSRTAVPLINKTMSSTSLALALAASLLVALVAADAPLEVVAAVFTPMTAAGVVDLNPSIYEQYVKALQTSNVAGAFVCGTNGESLSLSVAERQHVLEAWVAAAAGVDGFRLIVHVGAESLTDAVALAEHAQRLAVAHPALIAGVAAQPPSFFRPSSVAAVAAFMQPIAAAAAPLAFKYYQLSNACDCPVDVDFRVAAYSIFSSLTLFSLSLSFSVGTRSIPSLTNVALPVDQVALALRAAIPTFGGVKFSDPDLFTFGKVLRNAYAFEPSFYGKDEMILPALSIGCSRAVGSTYNFMAPVALRAASAYSLGNFTGAQLEQARIASVVDLLGGYGGAIPAQKAIMKMKGVDVGGVRVPFAALTDAQYAALHDALTAMGFFSWSN